VVESVAGLDTVLCGEVRRATPGGDMIDVDGYRPNVGIVLLNADGQLFWARRVNRDGWQFPQGGMRSDETPL